MYKNPSVINAESFASLVLIFISIGLITKETNVHIIEWQRSPTLEPGSSADPMRTLLKTKTVGCLIPQCTESWASASYKAPLLSARAEDTEVCGTALRDHCFRTSFV